MGPLHLPEPAQPNSRLSSLGWCTVFEQRSRPKTSFESGYGWKLGDIQLQGDLPSVKMASNGAETGPAALTALIEIPQVRSLKVPTCGRGQCIGWRVPVVARRRVSVAA
jgi:hypothetical protein